MDPLPLSLLNDFLFCNRRAGLKSVEGLRRANVHTLIGDLAHEHADLPGYEIAKGVTQLRALPVWSERLGLSGKCDIVEQHPGGALVPVEYKKSKRRHFDNDDVQLCAQALCLEEMFERLVERGAIFHAASKRRRDMKFTEELRAFTERTAAEVHALFSRDFVPMAVQWARRNVTLVSACLDRWKSLRVRARSAD
jgi:CRISPR-associated exonuclease Cas4